MIDDSPWFTYTIYFNPSDYPGRYVVRRFKIEIGNPEPIPEATPTFVGDTLLEARASVPPTQHRLNRSPDDDPVIVETWI